MIRYKVLSSSNLNGLKFPDLLVKYSTGYLLPLTVKEGQYIPLEILDEQDVKKSLIIGSLGRFVAGGQVKVEDDLKPIESEVAQIKQEVKPIIEQEVKPTIAAKSEIPQSVVEKKEPEKLLTNLSEIKQVDDFFKLGYFLKLSFIKNSTDKALLTQILQKTPVDAKQLQNNLQVKISQLP